MHDQVLIFILLGVILGQDVFIMYSHHKFVNKFMSRSYDEYKRAEVIKPKEAKTPKFQQPEEHSELGIL